MRVWRLVVYCFVVIGLFSLSCDKQPSGSGTGSETVRAAETKSSENRTVTRKEMAEMSITVQWINHASFRISNQDTIIYIDPWKLTGSPRDATIVLVSHGHYDHYSALDIGKVSGLDTRLIASADVISQEGQGQAIKPGETIRSNGVSITAVAAYNPDKKFHPKSNSWVGFIIELDSKRIYYAGDTDITEEMKALENIDLALLPVGGTYTTDAKEAAQAIKYFSPNQAIPYHWGDIVGSSSDAAEFSKIADCKVTVLKPGEDMSL